MLYQLLVRESYRIIFDIDWKNEKTHYQNEYFHDIRTKTDEYDGIKIRVLMNMNVIYIYHYDLNRSVGMI